MAVNPLTNLERMISAASEQIFENADKLDLAELSEEMAKQFRSSLPNEPGGLVALIRKGFDQQPGETLRAAKDRFRKEVHRHISKGSLLSFERLGNVGEKLARA